MTREINFMREAINLAQAAADIGEAPIGCVIVRGDEIIGSGYNRREMAQNALLHAEIIAIEKACDSVKSWRLDECEIFVTLEPCPMCAGAIINARIARVTFGAFDPKAGCFGSVLDFNDYPFNHKPVVTPGILRDECAELLSGFFKNIRRKG